MTYWTSAMIEQRHANLEAVPHAHLVGVAQQHVVHVGSRLRVRHERASNGERRVRWSARLRAGRRTGSRPAGFTRVPTARAGAALRHRREHLPHQGERVRQAAVGFEQRGRFRGNREGATAKASGRRGGGLAHAGRRPLPRARPSPRDAPQPTKRRIAAEEFVAAEARQRDFDAGRPHRLRDDERVDCRRRWDGRGSPALRAALRKSRSPS